MQKLLIKNIKQLASNLDKHKPTIIIGYKGSGKTKLAEDLSKILNQEYIINRPKKTLDENIEVDENIIVSDPKIYINSSFLEYLIFNYDDFQFKGKNEYDSQLNKIKYISTFLSKLFSKVNIIYVEVEKKYVLSNLLCYGVKQNEDIFKEYETIRKLYLDTIYYFVADKYKGKFIQYEGYNHLKNMRKNLHFIYDITNI